MSGAGGAGAVREDAPAAAGPRIAGWLCLAATPSFAAMAVLTGLSGGGPMEGLCAAGPGSPLTGMVPMYVLMSAFHAPPWLRWMAGRRRGAGGHGRTAGTSSAMPAARSIRKSSIATYSGAP